MARWNISGETVLLDEGPHRRSPSAWLRRYSVRIAVILGVVEALYAVTHGFATLMVFVGLASVLGYFWVRRSLPEVVRRPLGVLAAAQAIAGAAPLGFGIVLVLGSIVLLITVLLLLGDLRR